MDIYFILEKIFEKKYIFDQMFGIILRILFKIREIKKNQIKIDININNKIQINNKISKKLDVYKHNWKNNFKFLPEKL